MGSNTIGYLININLTNGSFISGRSYGGGTLVGYTITSQGNGWFRVSVSATANVGGLLVSSADGTVPTSGIYIWGAQLETGSTATAYQKVVSQYEVTEAGVQSASYIAFDGVDDGMVTPTITPGIDKVQAFVGVRKLSDAATGTIIEFSSAVGANNGSFALFSPANNGQPDFDYRVKGSTAAVPNVVSGYASPTTRILVGISDISADTSIVRVNGVEVGSLATDQGTGNYLAYPLYIGRRNGTTLPFNGRLYSLIVRFGPNLTDGRITSTESWVNSRTGAY
jgi:hypothetical protein